MNLPSAADRLERAREQLDDGRPSKTLTALGNPSGFPGLFRAEAEFLAAEAWRGRGFFNRAERLYETVLRRDARHDPALWIEAALGSAACMRSLGFVGAARKRLSAAAAFSKKNGLAVFLGGIELESALVDRAAGNYSKSLRVLGRFLKRHLRNKDWADAAFLYWAIGGALRFNGDLKESFDAFEQSLAMAKRAGDPIGQGYALFGLGGITRILGRLEASASNYARAKKMFTGADDIFGKAYAECGYANALRQLGRLDEARRHYEASHKLYSQLEDKVDLAYVEWGLGKINLHEGNLSEALKHLAASYRWFRQYRETRGEVLALQAMAQAEHAAGKTPQAEKLFDQAHRLSRAHGIHAHLEVFT